MNPVRSQCIYDGEATTHDTIAVQEITIPKKMVQKFLFLLLLFVIGAQSANAQGMPDDDIRKPAPDSFLVKFETSKGSFDAMVHRAWGPLAADRFYHLVRLEYFDEVSIFRVVPNYVAQFGIHNVEKVNRAWYKLGIKDEPVVKSNLKGTISFARGGPKTRTNQVFINLADNVNLDTYPAGGIVGYPPFAEIVSGIEVIDTFNGQYGNGPTMRQDSINVHGRAFLDRHFPGLDFIKTVRIVESY